VCEGYMSIITGSDTKLKAVCSWGGVANLLYFLQLYIDLLT
jgi:hypothetical protein